MTIEFRCGECSKLLRTTDDKAGASAKCPQCGTTVTVPRPSAPAHDDEVEDADDSVIPPTLAEPPPRRGTAPSPWPFADSGSSRPERPSSGGGGKRPCPMCGEEIQAAATRCRFCGETLSAPSQPRSYSSSLRPHRGGLILAFGILGIVTCPIFGVLAVIMGSEDMREMESGRMDPSGHSLTQAGKILGIIASVISALSILFFCLVMIIGAAAGN